MIRYNGIEIDTKARTIAHAGRAKYFSARRTAFERICYFILGGGVSLEMAFLQFYGSDPEGGPLTGSRRLSVLLAQWRTAFLDPLGLETRSFVVAGVSFYEILPKTLKVPPQRFAYARKRGGDSPGWQQACGSVRPKGNQKCR